MAEEAPVDVVTDPDKGDETNITQDEIENVDGEHVEQKQVEFMEGEYVHEEEVAGEHVEGEMIAGEQTEGEQTETEAENVLGEGEELVGEGVEPEQHAVIEKEDEMVVEEEAYVEPPPPDPAAPYDLSDSKELLKPPFSLRPDQLAEVEQLWALFQDYTPAYTNLDDFITEKELLYMLEAIMLTTHTPEQFEELIAYCCRPPHPKGHITYEQYLKIVTIRQRTRVIEEELRDSLQLLDPEKTGTVNREQFITLLLTRGHKMSQKLVDAFIKEVDIAGDGTIGIEDIIGTMGIDLNTDDLEMLRAQVYGTTGVAPDDEDE